MCSPALVRPGRRPQVRAGQRVYVANPGTRGYGSPLFYGGQGNDNSFRSRLAYLGLIMGNGPL